MTRSCISALLLSLSFSLPSLASDEASSDQVEQALRERSRGAYAAAERLLKKALKEDPALVAVHAELAITYWWQGHHRLAERAIQDALRLDQGRSSERRAWLHELQGRILLALGHRGQSEHALRKAIQLAPTKASHYAALGTTLRAGMSVKEADDAYDEALRLDPSSDEALNGKRQLTAIMRWETNLDLWSATISTEDQRRGSNWTSGGRLSVTYTNSPELKFSANVSQVLPTWHAPSAPSAAGAPGTIRRTELGFQAIPAHQYTLSVKYQAAQSAAPFYHALTIEGSRAISDTVILGSVRAGLDHSQGRDLLGQIGLQHIFSDQFWAMIQGFQYLSFPANGTTSQRASTGVLTLSGEVSAFNLRVAGGVGSYTGMTGLSASARLQFSLGESAKLAATYELFRAEFEQHQIGLNGGFAF